MKFTEILNKLNISYKTEGHRHSRPGWVNIDCPFCGKDSGKFHLGYSVEGNYLSCWKCGYHSLVNTLIELSDLNYRECKKLLTELVPTRIKKLKPRGKLILPKGIDKLQSAHINYLRGRGFEPHKLKKLWKIQGIGIASKLSWRIFIPIIYQNKIVSWTTRSISDKTTARYKSAGLNEETIPHKELLYGEDYARQKIIVTEGPIDVWSIGVGAVSTFGLGYTQAQINRMVRFETRAVCFDNDREAQKRAKKLCDDLAIFPGKTYNIVLDAKDAAASSKKDIEKLRKAVFRENA